MIQQPRRNGAGFDTSAKQSRTITISGPNTNRMVDLTIRIDQVERNLTQYSGRRISPDDDIKIRRRLNTILESVEQELRAINNIVRAATGQRGRTRPQGRGRGAAPVPASGSAAPIGTSGPTGEESAAAPTEKPKRQSKKSTRKNDSAPPTSATPPEAAAPSV